MVQADAFLADMPIEPTIAVDSLSRIITSFIIHNLSWQARKGFLGHFFEIQLFA
jgi:hypothetical protein